MADSKRVVVVGGGPAGYEAALEGARLGLSVTLVEGAALGGTCLNWGCIPTKFFLAASGAVDEARALAKMKILAGEPSVDLKALLTRKNRHLEASRKAMGAALLNAGVEFVFGRAVGVDGRELVAQVEGEAVRREFDTLILATGSEPFAPASMKVDGEVVLNSNHATMLDAVPESLAIIGAGAIGLEMASFFSALGAKVTLVEAADRLAPLEDEDVSSTLAGLLRRRGIETLTGARVADLSAVDGQADMRLEDGRSFRFAKALVAVGRKGLGDLDGLTARGVSVTRGTIRVDDALAAAEGVYAVGDVNGRLLLAHAASHQARFAVRRAAGAEAGPYVQGVMSNTVFGSPEIMRAGLMARELAGQGVVAESKAVLAANPMAQAHAATAGFVKAVWLDGRLAGMTAIGHGVSGLASLAARLVEAGVDQARAAELIFPHPGLDESVKDALLAPAAPVGV